MNENLIRSRLEAFTASPTPPHEPVTKKNHVHPCSWETYKKLQLLNFLWLQARKREAARDRYFNKLPHNRVIRKQKGQVLPVPIPMPEPPEPILYWRNSEKKDAHLVEYDFNTARYMTGTPGGEPPTKLNLSPARIDALLKVALEKLNEVQAAKEALKVAG